MHECVDQKTYGGKAEECPDCLSAKVARLELQIDDLNQTIYWKEAKERESNRLIDAWRPIVNAARAWAFNTSPEHGETLLEAVRRVDADAGRFIERPVCEHKNYEGFCRECFDKRNEPEKRVDPVRNEADRCVCAGSEHCRWCGQGQCDGKKCRQQ